MVQDRSTQGLRLMLAGDLMTGRGVDQVLPHHVDPTLYEPWVRDARDYVKLAERATGPLKRPVPPEWPWGQALAPIAARRPELRIVNLETAITAAGQPWPGKGIHYRMHPANIDCLRAGRLDACALANNHVLDWGVQGLRDTMAVLRAGGIAHAGAGEDIADASAPAILAAGEGRRVLLFSRALEDSGVPPEWGAGAMRPGVALLPALHEASARQLAAQVRAWREPGDVAIVSIHWGGNWVPQVPRAQVAFARRLIELRAADLVHGHSSHHPLPLELHQGRLILHGCGDLINDYEGIGRQVPFDTGLVCLWFATLADDGSLRQLEILPMQLRRLQLLPAPSLARQALRGVFPAGMDDGPDGSWILRP